MANSETFEELEQQIEAVLDSESTDFFELAAMLDLDPKQDFAGANLSGADLSAQDLSYANFIGTNLQGADLSSANLDGADFTNANLSSPLLSILTKISEDKDSANLFGNSSLNYYINLAFNIILNLGTRKEIRYQLGWGNRHVPFRQVL